jgi:hypothetical protein
MRTHRSDRNNSGQVLVITSLIVVMLLLSTFICVTETTKNAPLYAAEANSSFSSFRLGTIHAIMSALANVSNGGSSSILTADLNKYKWMVGNHSYDAILNLTFTPRSISPYSGGIWSSWNTDGTGVSSAYVNFAWNSSGTSSVYYSAYAINVTTDISMTGVYTRLSGAQKQANVTVNLLNEGKPALARNFTVYYEYDGSTWPSETWIQASPTITDYGNGTYFMSFTATTSSRGDPLLVSVRCHDLRYIFVRANCTLTRV